MHSPQLIPDRSDDRPASLWRSGAWLFPLALWFASTFFYMGQTGKYLNDWSYLRPDPGAIPAAAPDGPTQFWRPFDRLVFSPLITAFGEHDWFLHLLGALAHAGICLLLWRLLLLLRVNRLGAAIAVLCFMVYPACFEAVLWMSALPTLLAAALVVAAWLLACRYARGDAHPAIGYPVIPAIFFVSSSLNEQAACGVVAIPFLCLAARDAAQPGRPVLRRALFTTGLSAAAIAAAVALHTALRLCLSAAGPEALGAHPFLGSQLLPRIAGWIREQYIAADILPRAFSAGLQAAAEHPSRAAAICTLLIVGLVCWARSARRADLLPTAPRPGLLLIAALAACAAPIVPILAFAPEFNPRFAYAPALGLALAMGAASILLAPLPILASPAPRTGITTAAGGMLTLASITMMGFQRGYHERSIQDRRELAQLRALIPEPLPDSVFVPVRVDPPPTAKPRADRYDRYFASRAGPSVRSALQWTYGRSDLAYSNAPPDQVSLTRIQPESADVAGVGEVPWSRIIPFTIDQSGRARLVTSISAGSVIISIPQTQSLAAGPNEIALPGDSDFHAGRLTAGPTRPTPQAASPAAPPLLAGDDHRSPMGGGSGGHGDIPTAAASTAATCYANCDNSVSAPVLNVLDFSCFLNRFAVGDPYANCDGSTTPPVLNVNDFLCFLTRFAAGCP